MTSRRALNPDHHYHEPDHHSSGNPPSARKDQHVNPTVSHADNKEHERSRSEHHKRHVERFIMPRSHSFDPSDPNHPESGHHHQLDHHHSDHHHHGNDDDDDDHQHNQHHHNKHNGNQNDCVCGPNIYGAFLGPTVDEQILAGLSTLFKLCYQCPEGVSGHLDDEDYHQHHHAGSHHDDHHHGGSHHEDQHHGSHHEDQHHGSHHEDQHHGSHHEDHHQGKSNYHLDPHHGHDEQHRDHHQHSTEHQNYEHESRHDYPAENDDYNAVDHSPAYHDIVHLDDNKHSHHSDNNNDGNYQHHSAEHAKSHHKPEPSIRFPSHHEEIPPSSEHHQPSTRSLARSKINQQEAEPDQQQAEEADPEPVANHTSLTVEVKQSSKSIRPIDPSKTHQPSPDDNHHSVEPVQYQKSLSLQVKQGGSKHSLDQPSASQQKMSYRSLSHNKTPSPSMISQSYRDPSSRYDPSLQLQNIMPNNSPDASLSIQKSPSPVTKSTSRSGKSATISSESNKSASTSTTSPVSASLTDEPFQIHEIIEESTSIIVKEESSLTNKIPTKETSIVTNVAKTISLQTDTPSSKSASFQSSRSSSEGTQSGAPCICCSCEASSSSTSDAIMESGDVKSHAAICCNPQCPVKKYSALRSCKSRCCSSSSQYDESDTTKESSTSCTCCMATAKKSSSKTHHRKCALKKMTIKASKCSTKHQNHHVSICGCSDDEEIPSDGDGDSSFKGIRYAVTKITKFASYTTFEVMKSTRKKPKTMPTKLEGVFVLRNKKCLRM